MTKIAEGDLPGSTRGIAEKGSLMKLKPTSILLAFLLAAVIAAGPSGIASSAAEAALGKCTNLRWTDTAVLKWDKVENTNTYQIVVTLCNGTKKFSDSLVVMNQNSCDLEDTIVSLIRANMSSADGASYRVEASVQALTTDTGKYMDGESANAPSMRYMRSTYKDALSRNGWYMRSGSWYYYSAGRKQTGWVTFLGKKFFLDKNGRMMQKCWVGDRYFKRGGEMALNEWVGGIYVDSKGCRSAKTSLPLKSWSKTAKGWRFKKKNGKFARDGWLKIKNAWYYFDKDGNMKTGWLTDGGKKYYLSSANDIRSGRGMMLTGWVRIKNQYYWFDRSGAMATNTWVDRKQYYVGKNGRRLSWVTYANLRNVSTTNRLGMYVYSDNAAPEQSIAGYDKAYKSGNRIMVCDLRFTKDAVPVCFHDEEIGYARNADGSVPDQKPAISKHTLKELNNYDYGIKWGDRYKGTKALTLAQMAKWIKEHPDTELYIEAKVDTMSDALLKKTSAVLKKYGITNRSSILFPVSKSTDTRPKRMHRISPSLRIGVFKYSLGNVLYQQLKSAKGPQNDVFVWCWSKTDLDNATVQKLRSLNAQFESGTLDKFDDIIHYYARGSAYAYVTGLETDGAVFIRALKTATLHNKAVWKNTAKGKKYKQIDGTFARSKWVGIRDKFYHFDKNGIMQTGWLKIGSKTYYLGSDGARVTGSVTISGHKYQFGENGVLIKNR